MSAQWSVAPEVGLSAFNHNGIGDGWRPAIKIGAAVECKLKSNFSVESGLYYTQRGYSMAGIEVKRCFFRLGYDISLGSEFNDGVFPKYHIGTISVGYKF